MKIIKYLDKLSSLKDKTVLVSGSNAGIGFSIAKHILYKGGHLVMLCRSKERMNQAREKLLSIYEYAKIDTIIYDQASFESIKEAADKIINEYPNFDYLICNAGILLPKKGDKTKEGYPLTCGTNFIGLLHFLKCLEGLIEDSNKERRVIIQGSIVSSMHVSKKVSIFDEDISLFKQYNMSKKAVETLFYHLAVNNKNENVKYLLSEPGVCGTEILRYSNWFIRVIGTGFMKLVSHSKEKAALTAIKCLDEGVNNKECYIPKVLGLRGFPKKYKFNIKRYKVEYYYQGLKCLK